MYIYIYMCIYIHIYIYIYIHTYTQYAYNISRRRARRSQPPRSSWSERGGVAPRGSTKPTAEIVLIWEGPSAYPIAITSAGYTRNTENIQQTTINHINETNNNTKTRTWNKQDNDYYYGDRVQVRRVGLVWLPGLISPAMRGPRELIKRLATQKPMCMLYAYNIRCINNRCVFNNMCVYIYIYIYICIEREREARKRGTAKGEPQKGNAQKVT